MSGIPDFRPKRGEPGYKQQAVPPTGFNEAPHRTVHEHSWPSGDHSGNNTGCRRCLEYIRLLEERHKRDVERVLHYAGKAGLLVDETRHCIDEVDDEIRASRRARRKNP